MQQTYPERTTFKWEEKERLPFIQAIEMCSHALKQRGTEQRRATYVALVHALEAIHHEHEPELIPTKKLKLMMIAAANEHGWFPVDPAKLPRPRAPNGVPPDMKWCRRCREIKDIDGFRTTTSPSKARTYGWSEDTTIKMVGHLCRECRKAKQQQEARKIARRSGRAKMSDLAQRLNPEEAKRHDQYNKLMKDLNAQATRIRAAFSNAKRELYTPEGTLYEYQFKSDALRSFYESKRVLVDAARKRLDERLGEAAPLPDTWGMLLTREEQAELADLHEQAVMSTTANRRPGLWQ